MKRRLYLVAAIAVAVYIALDILIKVFPSPSDTIDFMGNIRLIDIYFGIVFIPFILFLVGVYLKDEFGDRIVFGLFLSMVGLYIILDIFNYVIMPVFFNSAIWIEHWKIIFYFQSGLLAIITAGYIAVGLLLLLKVRVQSIALKYFAWILIITGIVSLTSHLNVLFGNPFNANSYALVEYKYIPIMAQTLKIYQ